MRVHIKYNAIDSVFTYTHGCTKQQLAFPEHLLCTRHIAVSSSIGYLPESL